MRIYKRPIQTGDLAVSVASPQLDKACCVIKQPCVRFQMPNACNKNTGQELVAKIILNTLVKHIWKILASQGAIYERKDQMHCAYL